MFNVSAAVLEYKQLVSDLRTQLATKDAEIERIRQAFAKENDEVCQTLGKALGYPSYCDDQRNFPGATDENGVFMGEHVAATLAMEVAKKLASAHLHAPHK